MKLKLIGMMAVLLAIAGCATQETRLLTIQQGPNGSYYVSNPNLPSAVNVVGGLFFLANSRPEPTSYEKLIHCQLNKISMRQCPQWFPTWKPDASSVDGTEWTPRKRLAFEDPRPASWN